MTNSFNVPLFTRHRFLPKVQDSKLHMAPQRKFSFVATNKRVYNDMQRKKPLIKSPQSCHRPIKWLSPSVIKRKGTEFDINWRSGAVNDNEDWRRGNEIKRQLSLTKLRCENNRFLFLTNKMPRFRYCWLIRLWTNNFVIRLEGTRIKGT